jgi:hypothetical protein
MQTDQGSISSTYLRTTFTPLAPESVRIQSSCQYIFTLLGSTGAKAVHRTLMKLTPGVDFINILEAAFCPQIPKAQKRQASCQSYLRFRDLRMQKLLVEH